jgi:hypothetical protein
VARSNVIERLDGKDPDVGRSTAPAMSNSPVRSIALSIRARPADTDGSPRYSNASAEPQAKGRLSIGR